MAASVLVLAAASLLLATSCRDREREIHADHATKPSSLPQPAGPPSCGDASLDECAHQAWKLAGPSGSDPKTGAALLEDACRQKHAWSCLTLGHLELRGSASVAKDEAHACTLFQKACDLGDGRACTALGYQTMIGVGTAKDVRASTDLYELGCHRKDPDGCTKMGYALELGLGVKVDLRSAFHFYMKGHAKGVMDATAAVGRFHLDGLGGVPHDEPFARTLLEKACDAENPFGCATLGFMHANGRGGLAKDDARAVALYRKGCDLGAAKGCSNLAWMYEHGRGVARDLVSARAFYRKACDGGEAAACAPLTGDAGP